MVFAAGCPKETDTGLPPEEAAEKAQEEETPVKYDGLIAQWNDKIEILLTVSHPKFLYLSGPRPVSVRVPGNTPFTFTKNEFFITRPVFPMRIKFEVTRDVQPGIHQVPMGLRLMYCNKANDICQIKNDFLPIELMVEAKSRIGGGMTQTITKIYELQ